MLLNDVKILIDEADRMWTWASSLTSKNRLLVKQDPSDLVLLSDNASGD